MKIYFWFAVVVFVISLARPVFANPMCPGGSGTNTGRYTPTASTSSSGSNGNGASTTTGAAPAGIRR